MPPPSWLRHLYPVSAVLRITRRKPLCSSLALGSLRCSALALIPPGFGGFQRTVFNRLTRRGARQPAARVRLRLKCYMQYRAGLLWRRLPWRRKGRLKMKTKYKKLLYYPLLILTFTIITFIWYKLYYTSSLHHSAANAKLWGLIASLIIIIPLFIINHVYNKIKNKQK